MVLYGLGLGALAGIAHLVVRRYAKYADPLLLPSPRSSTGSASS